LERRNGRNSDWTGEMEENRDRDKKRDWREGWERDWREERERGLIRRKGKGWKEGIK
jgi:hypothetical protein